MKYRIVEEKTALDKTSFFVQYKFLFWWFYETFSDVGWHGEMTGTYKLDFNTIQEAKNYCLSFKNNKIVKYIYI